MNALRPTPQRIRYERGYPLTVGTVLRSRIRPQEPGVVVMRIWPWKGTQRTVQVKCRQTGTQFDWRQSKKPKNAVPTAHKKKGKKKSEVRDDFLSYLIEAIR